MPPNSQFIVDSPLEFRLLHDEAISECERHHVVDISLDRAGTYLAVALDTHVILYESSQSDTLSPSSETWALKGTYRFQNTNARVTSMSWTSMDILAIAFNVGEVALVRINFYETISKGFQVSHEPIKSMIIDHNMRYMAVAAGEQEIGIWESSADTSEWSSLLYIPLPPTLEECKDVRVGSIHWDNSYEDTVIVVVYMNGYIVSWALDFQTDEAHILGVSTARPPINGGALSPDGNHFIFPDPYESNVYSVSNLRPGDATGPFQCDDPIEPPFTAKFMFGGDWFLAPGIGKLYIWHVRSMKLVMTLPLVAMISLSVELFSGHSHTHRRIKYLSVCGLQNNEEIFDVKIAGYVAPRDKPCVPPRLLVWKICVQGKPPGARVPLRRRNTMSRQPNYYASGLVVSVLVLLAAIMVYSIY